MLSHLRESWLASDDPEELYEEAKELQARVHARVVDVVRGQHLKQATQLILN